MERNIGSVRLGTPTHLLIGKKGMQQFSEPPARFQKRHPNEKSKPRSDFGIAFEGFPGPPKGSPKCGVDGNYGSPGSNPGSDVGLAMKWP